MLKAQMSGSSEETSGTILTDPVPGQLWVWCFEVQDGSWPVQWVTTASRENPFAGNVEIIKRGNVFTVVAVDDPGPKDYDVPLLDSDGMLVTEPPKRWHVVLLKGVLCYMRHDWLSVSELVNDVRASE